MGIGVSLFLIAVGAILTWAVTADAEGIDVNTVGVILMIVGVLGLLLSLLFWSSWGGPGAFRRRTYVAEGPPARTYGTRREVIEEDVPGGPPPP